jgi:hypothetical protein
MDNAADDVLLRNDPLARTLLMQGLREDLDQCRNKLAPPAKEEV